MSKKEKNVTETETNTEKFHVVFQEADVAVLQKAFELDETIAGDVLQIRDDFAVGPLKNIETEEGWKEREEWWKSLVEGSPYSNNQVVGNFDDRGTVEAMIGRLNEHPAEELWLWMGQNQHDVCGYYWLMSQLRDFQGRVVVLYLNNLPFINEKGQIFYPTALNEIQPKEFVKAKKLNRKITQSEFEVDPDEWRKLCSENTMVRILEGGKKIVSKEEDFYDKDILTGLTGEWQKGNRAMQSILSKMKIKTGDIFLLWRMKKLAEDSKIEMNGDPAKGWKDFEVKVKSATPELAESDPNNQPQI